MVTARHGGCILSGMRVCPGKETMWSITYPFATFLSWDYT